MQAQQYGQKYLENTQINASNLKTLIQNAQVIAEPSLVTLKTTRQELISDQKLSILIYYVPSLGKKQAPKPVQQIPINPFLNPVKQLMICDLGDRHRLLFNKFNVYKNHLLVITKQFESQQEKVSESDMMNAALVCQALQGIIFFNGGNLSGASQPHKHLQILPHQAYQLPIFRAIYNFVEQLKTGEQKGVIKFDAFNFLHGIIKIKQANSVQALGKQLYEGYTLLFQELITKEKTKNENVSDYNLIACDRFILMAVREKEFAFDKLSVNSLGYMGSLLFKNQELFQQFLKHKPSEILESISMKI